MDSKKQWQIYAASAFGILLIIPIISIISNPPSGFLSFIIRLSALWGFVGLCLSSIMNLNKKILYQKFGLKFLKIHHFMAVFSLSMATLHPIAFAIARNSILVFIPDFSSWYNFWSLGGRPALIFLYIGLLATLLRKKSPKVWKHIHRLIYVALVLIFIHAILIGTDFQFVTILIFFSVIIGFSFFTFFFLRFQKVNKRSKK